MTIEFEPLIDEPALLVKSATTSLVVADIHLGIEWDLYRSGISIPSRMKYGLERIIGYIKSRSPDRVILLGDLKHNVPQISWQERDEIPYFLESLAEHARIDIFPGNHDGGIEHLVPRRPDITIHPVRGSVIEGVAYFHGHTWPDPSLLSAQYIVTAHNHPTIRFTDSLGYSVTEQSWIRTRLNMDVLGEHFRDKGMQERKVKDSPELIIVPSFNELCGGVAFNESLHDDLLGPMFSSGAVDIDNAQVYLLDGTCLGALKNIRRLEESRPGAGKRKRKVSRK
ncbi:metallophosphoesterase [Methanolobus chelungpuianus]|uniref:Phosphoesterase n=1 Tax=Methanolobus chelungpuianus TaxID=502115 RepID=A0AAE3H9U5_9EURY|nr:metallophosphoesterase [Methanolobus chelungpuianus]MCQ6962189.1 phosphoesterase [Methanolobus chelungpuianus]